LRTRFTQLVGCSVPIQQAPMGPVSSPSLAIAVAGAGGLGTIPASGVPAERLETLLSDLSSRATGVLAANFLTRSIDRDAVRAAASRLGIVDFFWSDPDPALVNLAHEAGALVSWQVAPTVPGSARASSPTSNRAPIRTTNAPSSKPGRAQPRSLAHLPGVRRARPLPERASCAVASARSQTFPTTQSGQCRKKVRR
jgi:Nitronate monooxygenase